MALKKQKDIDLSQKGEKILKNPTALPLCA